MAATKEAEVASVEAPVGLAGSQSRSAQDARTGVGIGEDGYRARGGHADLQNTTEGSR